MTREKSVLEHAESAGSEPAAADRHYRGYRPRPFTQEEIPHVEILFGGLHWRAERLLQAVLGNAGYRARILPTATRDDLLTGRELADIGQCCPTSFTTGNLANFLRHESQRIGVKEVTDHYVYVTAGSCGACRFGQYHQSYELALKNLGLESFRMFLVDQKSPDQGATEGGGLDLNMPLLLGVVWAILAADAVQSLEYRTRPYEVHPGETDALVRESMDYLAEVYSKRPHRGGSKWGSALWHLTTGYFVRALSKVFERFEAIEVDRLRVKPVVKITGEFYLQTVEGEPNYNIHRWLEAEGAEVYPAPIVVWLDYLLRFQVQTLEDYVGIHRSARAKVALLKSVQRLLGWTYNRMRGALGNIPHEMPNQYELRRLAAPYYHHRLAGGEGDMLVGKALWTHQRKKAHMICELSPYACMPNTMSIGAMAAVTGHCPGLLYAPIEVKGDSEVHALSRCQMILTEAKKRATDEFASALADAGITNVEEARGLMVKRPEMSRANFRIPHHGQTGMAANSLLELAGRARRRSAAA